MRATMVSAQLGYISSRRGAPQTRSSPDEGRLQRRLEQGGFEVREELRGLSSGNSCESASAVSRSRGVLITARPLSSSLRVRMERVLAPPTICYRRPDPSRALISSAGGSPHGPIRVSCDGRLWRVRRSECHSRRCGSGIGSKRLGEVVRGARFAQSIAVLGPRRARVLSSGDGGPVIRGTADGAPLPDDRSDGVAASGSPELVWEQFRSILLEHFGADRTDRWFGGLVAREIDSDGWLVLGAPNAFIVEWIEDTYRDRLNEIAAGELSLPGVRLVVEPPRLTRPAAVASDEHTSDESAHSDERRMRPSDRLARAGQSGDSDPRGASQQKSTAALPASLRDVSPNLTLDRFIVGSCNRVAYSAGIQALEHPGGTYNPIFVYGGCGRGKTHLLQGITREYFRQGERRIRYLPREGFVNRFGLSVRRREIDKFRERFRSLKVLVLDDIQVLMGKERTQLELLETIDRIAASGGQVILASDCRPAELEGGAEKLLGRFISGLVCRVTEPELDTRYAILRQEARASGVPVAPETILHLAERSIGNVRELIGTWVRVLAHASLLREPITPQLVEDILSERSAGAGRISIDSIIEEVGRRYGVPPIEFRGRSRSRTISLARHVSIYVARVLTEYSLGEIGEALGGRRHATTSAAYRKIQKQLLTDEQLRVEVERLIAVLRG